MKKINKEIKNEITLCSKLKFKSKPDQSDVKAVQMKCNSEIVTVTPQQLADYITIHQHSIHCAVFNLEDGPTFTDKTALYQNVFGLDVDHGNFTVEEVLSRCIVEPAIIHETFSSKQNDKRYRVYFFASQDVKNEDIKTLNKILNKAFWTNLDDYQKELIDRSCINPGRALFNGTKVVYQADNYFNPTMLLTVALITETELVFEKIKQHNSNRLKRKTAVKKLFEQKLITEKEYEQFLFNHDQDKNNQSAWDWNKSLLKNNELIHPKKEAKINRSTGELLEKIKPNSVIEILMDNLASLKIEQDIKEIDYIDAEEFISNLPLHKLLGVELKENLCCPFHDDSNGSASIFISDNGETLFKCHAECTKPLNTLSFIRKIFNENALTTSYYETLKLTLSTMGIMLGNQYQDMLRLQLINGQIFMQTRPDDDSLNKWLKKNNLHSLYYALIQLALILAPKKPIKTSGDGVIIYISLNDMYAFMRREKVKGTSDFKVLSKKINMLSHLGFIEKVKFEELLPEFKNRAIQHKLTTQESKGHYYRIKSFYDFPAINNTLWNEASQKQMEYVSVGGKIKKLSGKQLNSIVGKEQAKEVYLQSNVELNAKEQKFYELALKTASNLLEKQQYFTNKELLQGVDRENRYFGGMKEKILLADKINPKLMKTLNIQIISVNKKTREKYNINKKNKSRTSVFVAKL